MIAVIKGIVLHFEKIHLFVFLRRIRREKVTPLSCPLNRRQRKEKTGQETPGLAKDIETAGIQ